VLKKQTVWLLTMLSLMVVLSVYYFVAEKDNMAFNEIKQDAEVNEEEEIVIEEMQEVNVNELFTTIRMEIEDERNVKKDRFKEIVASNESTTNEINEALEAINELESITTKEQIL